MCYRRMRILKNQTIDLELVNLKEYIKVITVLSKSKSKIRVFTKTRTIIYVIDKIILDSIILSSRECLLSLMDKK